MLEIAVMNDVLSALRFYAVAQLAGLAAAPLCFVVLRRLPDRGWAAAKALGPLAVVYVAWLVGHRVWPFGAGALWACVALLGLAGAGVLARQRSRARFRRFVVARRRLLIGIESGTTTPGNIATSWSNTLLAGYDADLEALFTMGNGAGGLGTAAIVSTSCTYGVDLLKALLGQKPKAQSFKVPW